MLIFQYGFRHAAVSPYDLLEYWMLVDGVLLLTRRTPALLLVDGISLLLLGFDLLFFHRLPPCYGMLAILSGIWSLSSYQHYGHYLTEFQQIQQKRAQVVSGKNE